MDIDEFAHLSKTELRQAVSKLASAANKRLKRMSQSELVSPAYIEAIDSGGKFSTRGKSELELKEFSAEESMRLFYVAVTRAKKKLYITTHIKSKSFNKEIEQDPSIVFKNLF